MAYWGTKESYFKDEISGLIQQFSLKTYYLHPAPKMIKKARVSDVSYSASGLVTTDVSTSCENLTSFKSKLQSIDSHFCAVMSRISGYLQGLF